MCSARFAIHLPPWSQCRYMQKTTGLLICTEGCRYAEHVWSWASLEFNYIDRLTTGAIEMCWQHSSIGHCTMFSLYLNVSDFWSMLESLGIIYIECKNIQNLCQAAAIDALAEEAAVVKATFGLCIWTRSKCSEETVETSADVCCSQTTSMTFNASHRIYRYLYKWFWLMRFS